MSLHCSSLFWSQLRWSRNTLTRVRTSCVLTSCPVTGKDTSGTALFLFVGVTNINKTQYLWNILTPSTYNTINPPQLTVPLLKHELSSQFYQPKETNKATLALTMIKLHWPHVASEWSRKPCITMCKCPPSPKIKTCPPVLYKHNIKKLIFIATQQTVNPKSNIWLPTPHQEDI